MKFAKKKKSPPIWIFILAGVAVVALVLILVLSGGKSPEEPTEPTSQSDESVPDQTEEATAGEETGETTATGEEATESGDETQPNDETEATEATDTTEATEETRQTEPTEPSSGKETEPAQREDQTTMKTPYGTLKYPPEWAAFLCVTVKEGDPYTLTYIAELESGKSQELFAVSFGGAQDGAMGTIAAGGKNVPVHVQIAEFSPDKSWSESDINIVFTMQEALNQLLDSMPIDPLTVPPEGDPNLPKEDGEAMVVDTPYGELRYPSRWKDYLDLKVNDQSVYSVDFRCKIGGHNPMTMFVVYFGGNKGIPVGTAKDSGGKTVDIRLEVLELNMNDSWSDDDKRIAAAMQEDLNFLLMNLG